MTISIHWGQTATRKGAKASEQSQQVSTWLSLVQIHALEELAVKYNITEYRIIRGAFHDSYTRLLPIMENLGRDREADYIAILSEIAEAINWHYSVIDGAKAITMQKPPTTPTWERWKKNNPSNHLREASKKNWEAYHSFLGDLDEVGEWDDSKFLPFKN
jgi:hypothetical protein